MLISKPLLLVFSFLLCFCLFSKQADYISNSYCDIADATDICHVLSASDGTHLEANDQLDINDPFILPELPVEKVYHAFLLNTVTEHPYIPPAPSQALRPPVR